jgi:hypothetical protein
MLSRAGQRAFVELDLFEPYACATLVVPDMGGGMEREKPNRLGRGRSRLDPRTFSSETTAASPVVARLQA